MEVPSRQNNGLVIFLQHFTQPQSSILSSCFFSGVELRAVARGLRVPLRSLRDLGRHRDPERGQRRPPPDDLLAGDDLHLQQGQ